MKEPARPSSFYGAVSRRVARPFKETVNAAVDDIFGNYALCAVMAF